MTITAPEGRAIGPAALRWRVRPYRAGDVAALQRLADDILVVRYMHSSFPHPYTRADAEWWVRQALADDPQEHFVIEVDGEFAGAVSVSPRAGEADNVGIVGYWLGRAFWRRGIMTVAVRCVVEHAFGAGFRRLQATVYDPNVASARVLETCGFTLEGRLRQNRLGRDGAVMDELIYGKLADD